jgi:hypothetical protein
MTKYKIKPTQILIIILFLTIIFIAEENRKKYGFYANVTNDQMEHSVLIKTSLLETPFNYRKTLNSIIPANYSFKIMEREIKQADVCLYSEEIFSNLEGPSKITFFYETPMNFIYESNKLDCDEKICEYNNYYYHIVKNRCVVFNGKIEFENKLTNQNFFSNVAREKYIPYEIKKYILALENIQDKIVRNFNFE